MEQLLKEFKGVFAWTYKDLKGIPLELAQHKIELNFMKIFLDDFNDMEDHL